MRQLSGVDSSFLAWEGPTTHGHVTGVLVLDPSTSPEPWTPERFAGHLRSRLHLVPALTEKLVEVPLGLDRPYWVTDRTFDLDEHLHATAVAPGGGREEFADLVARIHERPLDRRRPLWECHIIEGLDGGQHVAVLAKFHHAAVDGLSGQEILAALIDLEPDPADDRGDPSTRRPEPSPEVGRDDPAPGELIAGVARSLLTTPARLARAGLDVAKALPVVGPGLGRSGPMARGDESMVELIRRFGAAPHTPFNAAIGPHRRWAYESVSLDAVKAIKNAAGTTVNDVVLAIVGGVLRAWLIDADALPDRPLAAMVPLSIRRPGEEAALGNYITPVVSTLATHLGDPAERLQAIKASMDSAKEANDALPAHILTDLTQVAPPAVTALAARFVASTKLADRVSLPFNLVVSNVPGPPIPVYLAGALVVGYYPVSAIADGAGLNVTVQSTNGMLDFGYVADRDLIPDLWSMADRTGPALVELASAIGIDVSP